MAISAWRSVPTYDEPAHLAAGMSHWYFGRFDLYRVNPPLVRGVAAIPLVGLAGRMDWHSYDPAPLRRAEFTVANDWLRSLGPLLLGYHTLGRWACVPLVLWGGYVRFRFAREL